MIGPYSYWQAALLMHSSDLDDMRDALGDSGPHDALGHKAPSKAKPADPAHTRTRAA